MEQPSTRLVYLLIAFGVFGLCVGSDDWEDSSLSLGYAYFDENRVEDDGNFSLPEMWFKQVLDHTNKLSSATWQQRYFVNSKYYKNDGPIFLILSGESSARIKLLIDSYVVDLAKNFSAICFLLEHRYYGNSQPMLYHDKETKSRKYLNLNQVLMDVVHFINGMRSMYNIPKNGKWIIFGSSYAGTLAAWMRIKFPHLVYGSVAQSAPLVAKVDYPDFFQFIHDTVGKHSRACLRAISDALEEFFIELRDSEGRKNLKNIFSLCNSVAPKNAVHELSELYDWFLSVIYSVTSNKIVPFSDTCEMMANGSYSSLEKLAALDNELRDRKNLNCLPPHPELQSNDVSWWYQKCTQFGWFQTTSSKPFNIFAEILSIDKYLKHCANLIGPSYLSTLELGVERTNLIYGGLDIIMETSKIIFIHGENDAWISASLRNSTNPNVSFIIVNGSGHIPFGYTPVEDNSREITKAKQQLQMLMSSWLK